MAIITDILALSPLNAAILSKLPKEVLQKVIRALYHAGQAAESNENEGEGEAKQPKEKEENLDVKDLKILAEYVTNEESFEIVLETFSTADFLKDEKYWILKLGKNFKVSQIYSPKPKSSLAEGSRDIQKFTSSLEALLYCKEQYDLHLSLGYFPSSLDIHLSDNDKARAKKAWETVNIGNKPSRRTKSANNVSKKREREKEEEEEGPASKKAALTSNETDKPVTKDKEEKTKNGSDEKSTDKKEEENGSTNKKKGKEEASKKKPTRREAAREKEEKEEEERKRAAELELEDLVNQPNEEGKFFEKYIYLDSAEPPLSFIIATLMKKNFYKAPFRPDDDSALMDCFFPSSSYLSEDYGIVGVRHVKYADIVRFYEYFKQITAKDFQEILDSKTKWPKVLGGFLNLNTRESDNQEYFTIHFNNLRRFFYNAVKYGRHILIHC